MHSDQCPVPPQLFNNRCLCPYWTWWAEYNAKIICLCVAQAKYFLHWCFKKSENSQYLSHEKTQKDLCSDCRNETSNRFLGC